MTNGTFPKSRRSAGSALILTIVLTSLLAIIGTVFIMSARVDRMSTSSIADIKTLDLAVDSIIGTISKEMVADVPGVSGQEYYDYPGTNDKWLASIAPYHYVSLFDPNRYNWGQISDVTGYINSNWGASAQQNVNVDPNPPLGSPSRDVIQEYQEPQFDSAGKLKEQIGDADGDGIGDSKWIRLADIVTSKGKPIYSTIRVIDNCGMVNVNTAYKFDPMQDRNRVDGANQTQVDLEALVKAGDTVDELVAQPRLWSALPVDVEISDYLKDFVWKIKDPDVKYMPYDIVDELDLRYRYCINSPGNTLFESRWDNTVNQTGHLFDASSGYGLYDWQMAVTNPYAGNNYRRNILTTNSIDRIIDPAGDKMVNINTADANSIQAAIRTALLTADPNFSNYADANAVSSQLAVNAVDFRDPNDNVTTIRVNGIDYYGFERPCIYISELAHNFVDTSLPISPVGYIYRSYAVELYKPYFEDSDPNSSQWRVFVDNSASPGTGDELVPVNWSGTRRIHVIIWEDEGMPAGSKLADITSLSDANDPNAADAQSIYGYDPAGYGIPQAQIETISTGTVVFNSSSVVKLRRLVNGDWVTVDAYDVRGIPFVGSNWLNIDAGYQSVEREVTRHKCIRNLWDPGDSIPSLGGKNSYRSPDSYYIQAHPEDAGFTNVGQLGKLFRGDVRRRTWSSSDTEKNVRLNLADPNYQPIFNYLTTWPDPNETIIKAGLILIPPSNVIATLPWISERRGGYFGHELAQAIVAYRDKLEVEAAVDYSNQFFGRRNGTGIFGNLREDPGFASIGELTTVVNNSGLDAYDMRYYAQGTQTGDLKDYPDLTADDGVADDFEERNLIFSRISNLITVRSDIFTAYILVRIDKDGPQKRFMAIFDRSGVKSDGAGGVVGDVKVLAFDLFLTLDSPG